MWYDDLQVFRQIMEANVLVTTSGDSHTNGSSLSQSSTVSGFGVSGYYGTFHCYLLQILPSITYHQSNPPKRLLIPHLIHRLDCDTNSEFCKKRRRLGVWRAIADITEAMREELGPDICAYSDHELLKALQSRGPVKYYSTRGTENDPGHLGLSTRKSGKFVIQWGREYGREKVD